MPLNAYASPPRLLLTTFLFNVDVHWRLRRTPPRVDSIWLQPAGPQIRHPTSPQRPQCNNEVIFHETTFCHQALERQGSLSTMKSGTPRSSVRARRGRVRPNCSPPPPFHCFGRIVETINIGPLQRISPRCTARSSGANIRRTKSGQPAELPQRAPTRPNLIRGRWASTGCPAAWGGGNGFQVLRKLLLGQFPRGIVPPSTVPCPHEPGTCPGPSAPQRDIREKCAF